mgnify:CR=1 FL=1
MKVMTKFAAAVAAFLAVQLAVAAEYRPAQEAFRSAGSGSESGTHENGVLLTNHSFDTEAWGGAILLAQLEAPTELHVFKPGEELPTPPPSNAGTTKWHPGHYVHVPKGDLSPYETEVGGYPVIRGYQKRYYWNDLEPARGKYDFSEIVEDLAYVEARDKYLVIQIQFKSFNENQKLVPSYLLTPEFNGGVYQSAHRGGWNLRLWNEKVLRRFEALLDALGERFDSYEALAGINLEESALETPKDGSPLLANWSTLKGSHAEHLAESGVTLERAFPSTPTLFYFNGGPADLSHFEDAALTAGIGMGGPDTYIGAFEDNLWLRHSYGLARRLAGTVPVGFAVQWHNYTRTGASGKWTHPGGAVPVGQIYDFSRRDLGTNFVFWVKRKPYWDNVKALLRELGRSGDPAGGLDARCPTMLRPCKT